LHGSIFETDRNNLVANLEELGLNVESQGLFILPGIEILQKTLLDVQNELGLKSPLSIVVDSARIILQGTVPQKQQSFLASSLFSGKSSIPVIINEITIQPDEPIFTFADVNNLDIYFEPSSSELTNQSLQTLDSVTNILHNIRFVKILIQGYADSVGSNQLNLQIAQKRAEAVKKYLLENGFSLQKIETSSLVLKIYRMELSLNQTGV